MSLRTINKGRTVVFNNRTEIPRKRWLAAHKIEAAGLDSAEDIMEYLGLRRHTWSKLLDLLKDEIAFDSLKRVLDIGCGPTSIFLALRGGEKYVVDPTLNHLFNLHPFVREVEEYIDVNFVSSTIEDTTFDKPFDLIFTINSLDHVGALKPVIDKIDELLAPGGFLVVIVDCYADRAARNIMTFFDADLPHPHHFIIDDISRIFSAYQLIKQDNNILELFLETPFRGKKKEIKIYRLDKFFSLMRQVLRSMGKQRDILFIARYILCYSLALCTTSITRREKPIYPLKKARLFVYQKGKQGTI